MRSTLAFVGAVFLLSVVCDNSFARDEKCNTLEASLGSIYTFYNDRIPVVLKKDLESHQKALDTFLGEKPTAQIIDQASANRLRDAYNAATGNACLLRDSQVKSELDLMGKNSAHIAIEMKCQDVPRELFLRAADEPAELDPAKPRLYKEVAMWTAVPAPPELLDPNGSRVAEIFSVYDFATKEKRLTVTLGGVKFLTPDGKRDYVASHLPVDCALSTQKSHGLFDVRNIKPAVTTGEAQSNPAPAQAPQPASGAH